MDTKLFICDEVLIERDICNLEKEKKALSQALRLCEKVLVYGRRNFGKTSVVKNVAAAGWLSENTGGFFLYADLYGVKEMDQLIARLSAAFTEAFKRAFPVRAIFAEMIDMVKSLRPKTSVSPDGSVELSFDAARAGGPKFLADVFMQLAKLRENDIKVLVVLDEFQEVHRIKEAEGLLRDCLQNLRQIPVILMGSKKHMLSKIFMTPSAPFFNWGTHLEFGNIPYDEFTDYMNERFGAIGRSIGVGESTELQDLMCRVPEAINRVCGRIMKNEGEGAISSEEIRESIHLLIDERRSSAEEYLSMMSPTEERVLTLFAGQKSVAQPTSKRYAAALGVTPQSIRKIVGKLEDEAVLYRQSDGCYTFADPLIRLHLLAFRPKIEL
ncbi:MAG: hypothetical protein HQK54_03370 [Oligoflexales bacterium]|nr:hypothetical protein [Oligoflexales bacterium]